MKPQPAEVSLVQGCSTLSRNSSIPSELFLQQESVGAGGVPAQCVAALAGEVGVWGG